MCWGFLCIFCRFSSEACVELWGMLGEEREVDVE